MADARQFEKVKSALGPAADCPPLDELARALETDRGDERRRTAEEHTARCAHCRDELALLNEFMDVQVRPGEARDVRWIAWRLEKQQLAPRSRSVFGFFWGMRPLVMAACLVIVAGSALYLRRGPGEPSPAGIGENTMRSQGLEAIAPTGDVAQRPAEFRWHPVAGAARYDIRVMEVDGREVWRGSAAESFLATPPAAAALMAPAKTLLWQVSAVDSSGKVIAVSATRSFQFRDVR